jgi:hypothetical protein
MKMIDAGVGISTNANAYQAGKEAAKEALHGMTVKPKVAILVIDGITRKKIDYAAAIKGVRDEIGPEPRLIGSTVNGIMVNDRFALRSTGLMLIGGDINVDAEFNFGKSRTDWEKIAQNIYNIKKGIPKKDNQFLLMFQDGVKFPPEIMEQQKMLNSRMVSMMSGLVGRIFSKKLDDFKAVGKGMPSVQEIIEDLYNKGWDIPIVGNVSTILKDYDAYEFWDNKVVVDGSMGLFLSGTGNTKFGFGYRAGAEPLGISVRPTKNIGNFLLQINNKPALEGFCEAINIEPESLKNMANDGYMNFFYMLGTSEKIVERQYIHLVGTITNPELPNLVVSAFPFNKVPREAEVFRSTTKILMKTTKEAIEEAMQNMNEPKFLLGIECIIRLLAYGDNYPKAVEIIRDTVGKDIPRLVFGSGGEIFGTKPNDYYFNNFTFLTFMGGQ